MTTQWRWRLVVIAHVNGNTPDNRTAWAEAFANNGSGQTVQEEREMFNQVLRVALAASPTIHRGYLLSTPVKAAMQDAILQVIADIDATLTAAQQTVYYGIAAIDGAMYQGTPYNEGDCFFASRAQDAALVGLPLDIATIMSTLLLVEYTGV